MLKTLPVILSGLNVTLIISLLATVISLLIGVTIAYINHLRVPILYQLSEAYLFLIRGTPVVAQIYFFYYGLAIFSNTIRDLNPTYAVSIVIALGVGAYMAESIRSGLTSVDRGQIEAAESLGMTKFMILVRIISPQAFRIALPNLFNNIIGLVKSTSLAFMIGVPDIMGMASIQGAKNFRYFDIYAVVMLVYLVVIGLMNIIYKYLDKKCQEKYM